MEVVILDGFTVTQHDLSWDRLQQAAGLSLTVHERTSAQDALARCLHADAVLTNKVVLSADLIATLPHLKYIGVLATGYNVVDGEAARQHGVVVTNIPSYSTASVAQLVFAHLLNVTNQVAHYADANRQSESSASKWVSSPDFTWSDTPLTELAGKTFAVYGLGNIGTAVAHIALAFGMKVLAVTSRPQTSLPESIVKASWEQALCEADVLSLHCPLTPETRALINREALAQMKPTSILINTGRGPLVDEEAVAQALQENKLKAYCADVLSTEPPSPDNPLLSAPRCFLTPHIAWATLEARQRLIDIATDNLLAFVDGKPVHVVNP